MNTILEQQLWKWKFAAGLLTVASILPRSVREAVDSLSSAWRPSRYLVVEERR